MQKIDKTKNDGSIRSIEDLLDKKIVDASGKTLGHVIDIQLSHDPPYRVVALMYGYNSLLYRLHVYRAFARTFTHSQKPKKLSWQAVERVDRKAIWLKKSENDG